MKTQRAMNIISTSCTSVHCFIVEDHCDIVPIFHSMIRAKLLPINCNHMIHFDSHPDLSLSKVSVQKWKNMKSLYESLETESGISEFLLPLLYKSYLSHVLWVKKEWCSQFKDGAYNFTIGDTKDHSLENDNIAGVTLKHSYYIDDSNICDKIDLVEFESTQDSSNQTESLPSNSRNIKFDVFTTRNTPNLKNTADLDMKYVLPLPQYLYSDMIKNDLNKSDCNWILDICLDYFSTSNPFLNELKAVFPQNQFNNTIHINELLVSTDDRYLLAISETIEIIQNLYFKLKFRKIQSYHENDYSHITAKSLLQMRMCALSIINSILFYDFNPNTNLIDTKQIEKKDEKFNQNSKDIDTEKYFYTDNLEIKISKRQKCEHEIPQDLMTSFLDLYDTDDQYHCILFVEKILPLLTPSIKKFISDANFQLLLPSHVSTFNEIQDSILITMNQIKNTMKYYHMKLPKAITIARSTIDDFTPSDQVDFIQEKLLKELDNLFTEFIDTDISFSNHSNNRIIQQSSLIVHPLYEEEDIQIAAYSLFLNPKIKQFIKLE